ncbi:MAG: HTH domain-containing protein [Halorientalis sp.]
MTSSHRRLELYLRDETRGLAGPQQDALIETAEALALTPAIDTVEIYEWPRKLAVEGHGPTDDRTLDVFNQFSQWARDHGVQLHPAFSTRTCYDWETGNRYTALVLPVMALAVFEDDELVAVYPHTDGETRQTVFDGLDALDTPAEPAPDDEQFPVPAK